MHGNGVGVGLLGYLYRWHGAWLPFCSDGIRWMGQASPLHDVSRCVKILEDSGVVLINSAGFAGTFKIMMELELHLRLLLCIEVTLDALQF